jgi:putative nucleotidyltransferase with HDIG domain
MRQPLPHHLPVLDHSLESVYTLELILQQIVDPEAPLPNDQHSIARIQPLLPFAPQLEAHLSQIMSDTRTRLVTVKLATLVHDIGKPSAQTIEEEGRIRFFGHDREGAKLAGRALRRLRFSKEEERLGETIVRHHMRPLLLAAQKSVSSRAVYRFFRDTRDAGVDVLLHALADHRATYRPGAKDERWSRLVDLSARMLTDYWLRSAERVAPPPLVSGSDLLFEFELQPGPRIGELLEAIREAQVTGEISTREEALAFIWHRIEGS